MKLKLVIVDLEIPKHVKRRMLRIGLPVAVLLICGGVVLAAGLHTWSDGDTLASTDLNGNFSALQDQITSQGTSLGGTPLASPFSPIAGQVLAYDGSAWTPTAITSTTGQFFPPNDTNATGVLEKYNAGAPYTVASVTITAPSAGLVQVSLDGQFRDWEHVGPNTYPVNGGTTAGKDDDFTCKLAPNPGNANAVTGSAPVAWHVGSEVTGWGPIGDPFTQAFATSYPFAVPAAGTYEFDFTCYSLSCSDVVTTGTYGCDVPAAHIYGIYFPAISTSN